MAPVSGSLVTAVVPLKALDRAKGRLDGALDPPDRRELTAWMFGRVVAALDAATAVGDVLVVVGDAAGEALAAHHGVRSLREPRPGLPQALAAADAATADRPATLVVAADLPLARPDDLDRVCAAGRRSPGPAVVVAPTQDGGTGALYRRPAGVVGTAFGPGSAGAHLALARAAGVRAVRLEVPRLALDVDTAEGLDAVTDLDETTRAFAASLRRTDQADPAA